MSVAQGTTLPGVHPHYQSNIVVNKNIAGSSYSPEVYERLQRAGLLQMECPVRFAN